MNNFDTDPAAEIAYLKALEKAKLNPAAWPAPVKAKKWPKADDAAKKGKKEAWPPAPVAPKKWQNWTPPNNNVEYREFQQGGVSRSEIIRGLFYIAGMLLFILLTEVL